MEFWQGWFPLVLAIFSVTGIAFGSEFDRLAELFVRGFDSAYQPNRCGKNIMGLIERARKEVDFSRAWILEIKNQGSSNFGMLRAHHAREAGARLSEPQALDGGAIRRFAPGPENWQNMHVVLEYEGRIFDFDFGNEPSIPGRDEYMRRMFLPPEVADSPEAARAVLQDYQVTAIRASRYVDVLDRIERPGFERDVRVLSLGQYLEKGPEPLRMVAGRSNSVTFVPTVRSPVAPVARPRMPAPPPAPGADPGLVPLVRRPLPPEIGASEWRRMPRRLR